MSIIKIIKGPQSTVEIHEESNNKIVKKIATERGSQDLIDQVNFYNNLPIEAKDFFPQMYSYNIDNTPFTMEMEYIPQKTFRDLLIYDEFNEELQNKINNSLNVIHDVIHPIHIENATKDYVTDIYINRCISRVEEVKSMTSNSEWILNDFILNGEVITNPIKVIIKYLQEIKNLLIPDYICSTHGQLGPSHIIFSSEFEFKLLDPKGFDKLHDPLIDVCKIGKAMLYATEWLEDQSYEINFSIDNSCLNITNFKINNYNKQDMHKNFEKILDFVTDNYNVTNVRLKTFCLICADLIGGLPFGMKTEGEKRVAALLILIHWAKEDLEKELTPILSNYNN